MGAKNNGVFICKSKNSDITYKKASCIIINKGTINFSKKNKRENRHKIRNYKRKNLAKRLLKELVDFSKYDKKQVELILGLLNNRGYTIISTAIEFETLNNITIEFISEYLLELKDLKTKEDFEVKVSSFNNLEELKKFIKNINDKIEIETKKKKAEFYKEFQNSFSNFIKKDLTLIKDLFNAILNELETGSKPRKKYLKDIKEEINTFDFIEDKESFFNLIGNISNLQLRVLRKFFNFNSSHKDRYEILKKYFKAHHYKSIKDKQIRDELLIQLEKHSNLKEFLQSCDPVLTIPPYEDMNNRNTYKCNSMLIKPEIIDDELKNAIDNILEDENFEKLLISDGGEFKIEDNFRVKPSSGNKYIKTDFTYSKYLQRILDSTPNITTKELNPRDIFKYKTPLSIKKFKERFGDKIYSHLEKIATLYYKQEDRIHLGIYEKSNSIFVKCNTNTPYKNNVKHIMLKPLYSYNFTSEKTEQFIKKD